MFKKATKEQTYARVALFGPSGSGKTFGALRIATGLAGSGGSIAYIDTERSSARKYADRFSFDHMDLETKSIDAYLEAISAAKKEGYKVLIIDSLSHGWQELLQEVERIAQAKFKGNTWSAWSQGNPKQKRLIDAILDYPGHVIATMRSKTEWTIAESGGKKTPQRVGLSPEQGKGIEYEFDLLVEVSPDHVATVLKDRSGKFQDTIIDKIDENFGKALAEWLSEGEAPRVEDKAVTDLMLLTAVESLKTTEEIDNYVRSKKDLINDATNKSEIVAAIKAQREKVKA